jgi:hypothetical protein
MSSHPLYWLLFVTLILVIAFAVWSFASTKGHEKSPEKGLGGPNDPMG